MIDIEKLTKRYYSISEVADMFGIASSVLRYWESEFSSLKPTKGRNGVRRYTPADITLISDIYGLLKEEGFTIEGAKRQLKQNKEQTDELKERLILIKDRIQKLRDRLDE